MCSLLAAVPVYGAPSTGRGCADKVSLDVYTVLHDGVKGSWLPPTAMNRVLFVLEECVPSYEAIIEKQTIALNLSDKVTKTASSAIDAAHTYASEEHARGDAWKQAFADEHRARMDLETVWRSPTLWFAVGVVGGTLATIGIAKAIKSEVRNP